VNTPRWPSIRIAPPASTKTSRGIQRTLTNVLHVANQKVLIEENPPLYLSLTRRDPYLDPLNHIQLTLPQRYRNDQLPDAERDIWLDPLLRSINAIAGGMRNTG